MIPNRLVRIEKIPVNINGKLDSRALPEVNFTKYDQNELGPPRNDLEAKIAQIWSELLGIPLENIGIHDDFFSLGGDSILVIKLSLMLSNSLSVKLTVSAIFQNKTIAKLASYILHGLDSTAEDLLLSAYTLMLSNYANQQDIVIGTPVVNRNQPELENLIGFFVNMLVLRIKIDGQDRIIDYIRKVSNEVISAQIHQDMPFERLVKELQIENDSSRHPIVQVVFLMNNQFEVRRSGTHSHMKVVKSIEMSEYLPNHINFKTAKYDISTSINEYDICLRGHFNFATKLFHESTIHNFIDSFIHILSQFSRLNETCKVMDIDCINSVQYNQVQKWNHTDIEDLSALNKQTTLQKVFEEEAKKSPEKIAVVYEDVQLTYKELNQRANQLAHYLQSISNICPDDLIALLLDKSELMIISILSVWKSGAAYVPIDPSYPDERI
ncbi:unnamed protein product, partial [Rotaria sp. Silwood1]